MNEDRIVDFFYLSMPVVTDEGDGSQDALVVRLAAGGHIGWGECEASPLVSIAAHVCPMSHGACRPVADSVLGQTLASPSDIARIAADLELNSMDLLQAPHTFSGIEMAMWDVLGRAQGEPVYRLLGYDRACHQDALCLDALRRRPSRDLGPCATGGRGRVPCNQVRLGPVRTQTVADDADQLQAAREGLGPDGILLVDAGQIWREDVDAAAARLPLAGRRQGNLAGGAVCRPCLRGLRRAGRARFRAAGRWRGCAQCPHGAAPDRFRQGRFRADRLRHGSAASARPSGSPIMRCRRG